MVLVDAGHCYNGRYQICLLIWSVFPDNNGMLDVHGPRQALLQVHSVTIHPVVMHTVIYVWKEKSIW